MCMAESSPLGGWNLAVLWDCDEREVGGSILRCIVSKPCGFYVQFLQEAEASESFSGSQEIPVVLSDYPGIPRAQKWCGSHPRLWIPRKGNSLPDRISFFVQSLAVKAMLQNTTLKDSYFVGTALITLIQGHFMLALCCSQAIHDMSFVICKWLQIVLHHD